VSGGWDLCLYWVVLSRRTLVKVSSALQLKEDWVPETIVVPLDGSAFAERALGPAAAVARRTGASVIVLTARQGGVAVEPAAYLTQVAEAAGIADPEPVVIDDRLAASAIVMLAHEARDPLVCMTTHARGGPGHALFGSVAEEVLRRVPAPVLLVGPRVPSGILEFAHLVVGLDGSDYSTAILTVAASLAVALGVDLTLVTVLDPTARSAGGAAPDMSGEEASNLERLAKGLEADCGPVAMKLVPAADPAHAIVELAASRPGTVVALTSHGRTGLARLTVGSVTMAVVRNATCPILTLRPPGLEPS
jgi:nucleotide-binding universal stress UspA family protein